MKHLSTLLIFASLFGSVAATGMVLKQVSGSQAVVYKLVK